MQSFERYAPFMQVMQKHQKYFAVRDDSGRLLPYFVAVRHSYHLCLLCELIFKVSKLFVTLSRLCCLEVML